MKSDINVLALAYLGDVIYEFHVRKYLINSGIVKVNELQKRAVLYVSANAQSEFLEKLLDKNFLSEEEISIVKRARNHKGKSNPKNTSVITYKRATGLEALIGYLYIEGKNDRVLSIMNFIFEEEIC